MSGRERFELLRPLGSGGSAKVHLARDRETGAEVALKLLELAPDDVEGLVRFRREAEALARLSHPRIVRLVAWGLDGGPWLALEHLECGSVAELVARRGPLPERQTARIGADLARALDHAHRAGVLHRDVKPANLVLDREQQIRLVDFGLARPFVRGSELTVKGALLGTPGYMAPELALGDGDEAGPSTDVYGLGASLYHLLTGHAPFEGTSALSVMEAVVRERPARPSLHRAGIDPGLEQVVLRCLAKEPAARPEMAALIATLERHARRRAARERSFALPAALGLLVGGVALAAAVVASRTPGPAPAVEPIAVAAPASSAAQIAAPPAPEVDAQVERARARFDGGDSAGALRELDGILELHPAHVGGLCNRALIRSLVGDPAGARADYDRVLAQEPDHPGVLLNRASLRADEGDLEGALADVEHGLAVAPPANGYRPHLERVAAQLRARLGR